MISYIDSKKIIFIHNHNENGTSFYQIIQFCVVRLDLVKNRLNIGLFIPSIKVESKYDLKGNLLLLPLVGVGDAKLYLSKYLTRQNIK